MKAKNTKDKNEPNSEWASAIKNILSMDKPKSKNSMILSRAEKLDPKLEKDEDEPANKISEKALLRKEWLARGRYKPIRSEEGEKERKLRRIAIAGVVQLFNTVGQHQRENAVGSGSTGSNKKSVNDKVFKPLDKKSFFDILLGKEELKKEIAEPSELEIKEEMEDEIKEEEDQEEDNGWEVLRNDFMMSTKLKDWDKQTAND